MSKQERKQIVRELIKKFLNDNDPANLRALKVEIINLVGSAGYTSSQVPETKSALLEWGNDIDKYIKAVEENHVEAEMKQFTHLSLLGLLTLIDTSQLQD